MLTSCRSAAGSARQAAPKCHRARSVMSMRCVGGDSGNAYSAFEIGAKVKVIKSVKVFHVPKVSAELELEGLDGVITKNVVHYKGKLLSSNLPYVVQFLAPAKFNVHLAEDEIAAL